MEILKDNEAQEKIIGREVVNLIILIKKKYSQIEEKEKKLDSNVCVPINVFRIGKKLKTMKIIGREIVNLIHINQREFHTVLKTKVLINVNKQRIGVLQ